VAHYERSSDSAPADRPARRCEGNIKRTYDSRDVDNTAAVSTLGQSWANVVAQSDNEEIRVDVLTGLCLAYRRHGIADILQKRLRVRDKAELV
jgi:hypothetical protein